MLLADADTRKLNVSAFSLLSKFWEMMPPDWIQDHRQLLPGMTSDEFSRWPVRYALHHRISAGVGHACADEHDFNHFTYLLRKRCEEHIAEDLIQVEKR